MTLMGVLDYADAIGCSWRRGVHRPDGLASYYGHDRESFFLTRQVLKRDGRFAKHSSPIRQAPNVDLHLVCLQLAHTHNCTQIIHSYVI